MFRELDATGISCPLGLPIEFSPFQFVPPEHVPVITDVDSSVPAAPVPQLTKMMSRFLMISLFLLLR